MQCRYNNGDHNNSCDQGNKGIIILRIQHEVKLTLQIYPPNLITKNFF